MVLGKLAFVAVLGSLSLAATSSLKAAVLLGSSVTGSFTLAVSPNLFDPVQGDVPSGYSNTSGTMVTVTDPGIEFGYQGTLGGANLDTVEITASQIIITDVSRFSSPLKITLTDTAFLGITAVSDNFPGGSFSFSGDTFTFTTSKINSANTFTAVFDLASSVPELSTWAMLLLGLFGVGLAARLGKSKPALLTA